MRLPPLLKIRDVITVKLIAVCFILVGGIDVHGQPGEDRWQPEDLNTLKTICEMIGRNHTLSVRWVNLVKSNSGSYRQATDPCQGNKSSQEASFFDGYPIALLVAYLCSVALIAVFLMIYIGVLKWNNPWKSCRLSNTDPQFAPSIPLALAARSHDQIIIATNAKSKSYEDRLLKKAVGLIELNLANANFGVAEMAKEMGMSRTHMHRKIKAISGRAPRELIRSIRLQRAAELLAHQADSVSQISLAVGFEDHSYFSKSFKKEFGVPPSDYFAARTIHQHTDV